MGFLDEAKDFGQSVVDTVTDDPLKTIATGGANIMVDANQKAINKASGRARAEEAEAAAKRMQKAQMRLFEQKTLRQKRNQIRQARFGRAAARAQQEMSGIGGDSSVSATAQSSLRSQLSANLASMRAQLTQQEKIADEKGNIRDAQSPGDFEFAAQMGMKAFGAGFNPIAMGASMFSGGGSGVVTNTSGNAPTTNNFLT